MKIFMYISTNIRYLIRIHIRKLKADTDMVLLLSDSYPVRLHGNGWGRENNEVF